MGKWDLGRDFAQLLLVPLILFLCCAPFPMDMGSPQGVGSRKGAGKGGNSLSLVILLCPGVISSGLFSLIFFVLFVVIFHFSSVSAFFPPVSPFPWDSPET